MHIELTGNETGDELIKQLVYLRHCARNVLLTQARQHSFRADLKQKIDCGTLVGTSSEGAVPAMLAELEQRMVDMKFAIVEIGQYLNHLCPALDQKASREAFFDAINTNKAHRDTAEVHKWGDNSLSIICVLKLENSATEDSGVISRPLSWCHTMAFMNALNTNSKLDRVVHEEVNKVFDGAFGEYRERPLMERLTGGMA